MHNVKVKSIVSSRPKTCIALLCIALCAAYFFWPLHLDTTHIRGINSTRVLDKNGTLLREIRPMGRGIPIHIEEINPYVLHAAVAIEDRHFYEHVGIHLPSIFRALKANIEAGQVVQGGSTLTMQVARALQNNPVRSITNKIAEGMLALRLELHLTKKEILGLWLNKVYFGNQAYGIESASQLYFGKSARDLNAAEAAFLVGLPQRPNGYDPYQHLPEARERQHRVLSAMVEEGMLSDTEAAALQNISLDLQEIHTHFKAPHFISFVQNDLPHQGKETLQDFSTIQTTLDLDLQQTIEALARAHLQRLGNDRARNAAALVLENDTGNILAYMGSQDFWDVSIEGQNDGVTMLRQPGSTLKPFTYGIALASKKYTPATILPDIEVHIPEAGGAFSPLNYDKKFHGPVPLRTALASSYNVPAVRIAREFGSDALLDVLYATGITSLNKGPDHYGVGLTLGNGEVQLLELANAYATLARIGNVLPIQYADHKIAINGDTLRADKPTPKQSSITPEVAYLLTHILQDPEARAPAFGRHGPLELPFPVSVKTGTSKDYRDNWAVGFTPKHTVAVWVGNFDGSPMRKVSGVSGAGPFFHSIMLALGSGGDFEQPAGVIVGDICPISGNKPGKHCPGVKREVFLAGSAPTDTCTIHQMYNIDSRDGTLAGNSTPAAFMTPTLYTVYPNEYDAWMKENGIAKPPAATHHVAGTTLSASAPLPALPRLNITFPKTGMIFQIDPVLNPAYQRIKLQGLVDASLSDPVWLINKIPATGSFDQSFWTLQEGIHEILLQATDPEGRLTNSSAVTIRVLPANASSAQQESPAAPATTLQ